MQKSLYYSLIHTSKHTLTDKAREREREGGRERERERDND
jgi:hypothetical protein